MALTKKTLVISHANCDDGMAAAWVAWSKLGDAADYWFAPYNAPPPEVKGKDVYLFDFSYPRAVLEKMDSEANSLVVLDHHKTAEKDLKGLGFCHFDKEKCGAMLAWDFFYPGKPIGALLYHIQDYDLWKFECPRTENFIKCLRSYPQNIQTFNSINQSLEDAKTGKEFYEKFLADGEAIGRYFKTQLAQNTKSTARDVVIKGIKGKMANLPGMFASEAGSLLATQSGTFGMTYFVRPDNAVKCSIRSIKGSTCDVSLLAETFGGGGHENASGFNITLEQLNTLLNTYE